MADKITFLPTPDVGQYTRFQDYILKSTAAALGVSYDAFRPTFERPPELRRIDAMMNRLVRKSLEDWYRARERLAALYLFGYDPQMLLEDQRHGR